MKDEQPVSNPATIPYIPPHSNPDYSIGPNEMEDLEEILAAHVQQGGGGAQPPESSAPPPPPVATGSGVPFKPRREFEDWDDEEDAEPKLPEGGFQEIMQKAMKLKTAQLAQVRQYYETCPGFMKSTVALVDRHGDELHPATHKAKVAKCKEMKRKGNELFREQNYIMALDSYARGIAVFRWFKKKDSKGERLCLQDYAEKLPPDRADDRKEVEDLLVGLILNCAITSFKMGDPDNLNDAEWSCREVLKMRKDSVKAYYRLALVNEARDTSFDLDKAWEQIREAKKLDPSNMIVAKKHAQIRKAWRMQRRKEKSQFSGLFERGRIYDEEDFANSEEDSRVLDVEGSNCDTSVGAAGGRSDFNAERFYDFCKGGKDTDPLTAFLKYDAEMKRRRGLPPGADMPDLGGGEGTDIFGGEDGDDAGLLDYFWYSITSLCQIL